MIALLDTSVFIRYAGDQLPRHIDRLLCKSTTEILISVITPWEIALKPSLAKIGMTTAGFNEGFHHLGARLVPITLEHIEEFTRLPPYHEDPFDRMIIAQSLIEKCPVITSDQRFPLYSKCGLVVLWER